MLKSPTANMHCQFCGDTESEIFYTIKVDKIPAIKTTCPACLKIDRETKHVKVAWRNTKYVK